MALLRNTGHAVFMENVDITNERYTYHNIRERCVCDIINTRYLPNKHQHWIPSESECV